MSKLKAATPVTCKKTHKVIQNGKYGRLRI